MPDIAFPERPLLRPDLERVRTSHEGEPVVVLIDPSGLGKGQAVLTPTAFAVASLFDGRRSIAEIQEIMLRQFGAVVPWEPIRDLIVSLEDAHMLHSPRFVRHWNELAVRPPLSLLPDDSPEPNRRMLRAIIDGGGPVEVRDRVVGLIAPHLDYERGRPCYADIYRVLAERNSARRFIILGTNHFYPTFEITATAKDFRTPLGIARNDTAFLRRLESRLGVDLCRHEFAHLREHSIELQVRMLQHLLGTDNFTFVPFLCPDPCGPAPLPGLDAWAESDRFAAALRQTIAQDDVPTCLIAGADLAHIGRRFGDDADLEDGWLARVGEQDRTLLSHVEGLRPREFLEHLCADKNARRVCSAGCISTLMKALDGRAKAKVLRYHQAVTKEAHTAVTCCAAVFTEAAA